MIWASKSQPGGKLTDPDGKEAKDGGHLLTSKTRRRRGRRSTRRRSRRKRRRSERGKRRQVAARKGRERGRAGGRTEAVKMVMRTMRMWDHKSAQEGGRR